MGRKYEGYEGWSWNDGGRRSVGLLGSVDGCGDDGEWDEWGG